MKKRIKLFKYLLLVYILAPIGTANTMFAQDVFYELVTNVNQLVAGDYYLIVSTKYSKALGAQNTNNRKGEDIEIIDNKIYDINAARELLLEGETNKWTFKDGNKYLSSSKEKELTTKTSIATECKTTITIDNNANAIIKFNSTKIPIVYYPNSRIFSCYSTNYGSVQLYRKKEITKPFPEFAFTTNTTNKIVKTGEVFQTRAFSPLSEGNITYSSTNTDVATVNDEGKVTALNPGKAEIAATISETENYRSLTISYPLTVVNPNSDLLTSTVLGIGQSYTNFSGIKKGASRNGIFSDAVYAGFAAKQTDGRIVASEEKSAGIITTQSGGKARKIIIEWTNATNGSSIDIYGSNEAYNTIDDVKKSTSHKIGTITRGTSDELNITGDYSYIGIMPPASGTLYAYSITVCWDPNGIDKPEFSIADGTYMESQEVTITSEEGTYLIYNIDGTTPTLDNGIKTSTNSATVTIDGNCTLKAIAVSDSDQQTSSVASAEYNIIDIVNDGSFDNPYSTNDIKALYAANLYNSDMYVWINGSINEGATLGDIPLSLENNTNIKSAISTADTGQEATVCCKIGTADSNIVLTSLIRVNGLCLIPITTAEGYGTYYNDYAFEMPQGLIGYIITNADIQTGNLTLESKYTEKQVVPSGTALLIKGSNKTYSANITNSSISKPTNNLLYGADDVDANGYTYVEGQDMKYYILSYGKNDRKLCFHYAVENGMPIKYHKPYAFLAVNGTLTNSAKGFSFFDNETTNIHNAITEKKSTSGDVYTTQGIKVNAENLKKGIYIMNNKKILVK